MVKEINRIGQKPSDNREYLADYGKHIAIVTVRTLSQMEIVPRLPIYNVTDASLNVARNKPITDLLKYLEQQRNG